MQDAVTTDSPPSSTVAEVAKDPVQPAGFSDFQPVGPVGGKPRGGALATVALSLSVLAAGAMIAGTILYGEQLRGRFLPPSALQLRVTALENAVGTSTGSGTLTDRLAALDASVATVNGRIESLAATTRIGTVLAARELRTALSGGEPFATELALLQLSGVPDGDLAQMLAPVAGKAAAGIPTRDSLLGRFVGLVPEVLKVDVGAAGASGIGETMWGWVSGIGSAFQASAPVSPADPNPQSATPSLLARSAIQLEAGDLAGAADRVAQLDGAAASVFAPWLTEAQSRLAADRAVAALDARIAALLSQAAR